MQSHLNDNLYSNCLFNKVLEKKSSQFKVMTFSNSHLHYFWKNYLQALIRIITADMNLSAANLQGWDQGWTNFACYSLADIFYHIKIQNINIKYNRL